MLNLLIAESTEFSPVALERLRARANVIERDLSRDQLLGALADVDALWVRLRNRIDAEVFDAAPRLKIVVSNTTGLDHIDVEEAARRHIRVLSLRDETAFLNTVRGTAELTLGLLLALVRRLPEASAHARSGGWDRYPFKGHDLFGKTAGVVGYGRLGRIVGGYLSALGMRVLATTKDIHDCTPEPGVTLLPLDDLLSEADVVTLHVNLNAETRGMMTTRHFNVMKHGSWFVNTARGELVDEVALVRALESGRLAGAAVDVVANRYDVGAPSPLRQYAASHENLLVTPHIGGYTFESLAKTEIFLADRLLGLLEAATVVEESGV